ncbi:UNVERIFIED_CONTAM: hypothetical protein FKN15_031354 [Acipenser sinensis]
MHFPKKCSVFKVVLSALLLVALLQLMYLSLLSKLHGKQQRYKYSELFETNSQLKRGIFQHQKNTRKERLKYSLSSGGIFDQSGQYRVYKNIIKSEFTANHEPRDSSDRTKQFALATHTSIKWGATCRTPITCCATWPGPACELHVAGYSFSVLSSAFLVHRGFKVSREFHARKDEENRLNRVLFRQFKEELKLKYQDSTRCC